MRLEVAFVPGEVRYLEGSVCVVLDIIRASSSLTTIFERGIRRVLLAESIDAARDFAARATTPFLLCGEQEGLPPYGFDHGNSPTEFSRLPLQGKEMVFCTSNGTKAAYACAGASAVLIGCFLNARAVVTRALSLLPSPEATINLVCAGREGRFVLDDALCAGYLAGLLNSEARVRGLGPELNDAARASLKILSGYPNLVEALYESASGRALRPIGLEHDISYCARTSVSAMVPELSRPDAPRQLRSLHLLSEVMDDLERC